MVLAVQRLWLPKGHETRAGSKGMVVPSDQLFRQFLFSSM